MGSTSTPTPSERCLPDLIPSPEDPLRGRRGETQPRLPLPHSVGEGLGRGLPELGEGQGDEDLSPSPAERSEERWGEGHFRLWAGDKEQLSCNIRNNSTI